MRGLETDMLNEVDQLDRVSGALLPIIRHFLDAFQRPESLGWRHANSTSIGVWGEARGLSIANGVQIFLAAVLKNRPVPVRYIDPLNIDERKKLTLDEIDILTLLSVMRSDQTARAREIIIGLTGGQIPDQIVRSGLKLAQQLDSNSYISSRTKTPKLTLVSVT